MGSYLPVPLGVEVGWGTILKRTLKETFTDNCLGLAAQLAYYFFLSLFPALLVVVALTSFFPSNLLDQILIWFSSFTPPDVLLLWFYLSGLVLLIGAELNSEIEHASPYGKDEGERVPGEHRHWMFRTRRHGGIGETPEPDRAR